jgi:hypothetical protein
MWASVVTDAAALAGSGLVGFVQLRGARAERRENRREARRAEMAAVTSLSVALADHRRATWVLGVQRLSYAAEQVVANATTATHETWAAVTAPLVTVKVLAPEFVQAAEDVTDAIYTMLDAPDMDALEARRAEARTAHDHLMTTAADALMAVA